MKKDLLKYGHKLLTALSQKFLFKHIQANYLYDPASGLPFLNTVFPEVSDYLVGGGRLALLYVDLQNFSLIEHMYGRKTCDLILKNIGQLLPGMPVDFFGYRKKIAVCTRGGDDFLVFIDAPINNTNFVDELRRLRGRFEDLLNKVNADIGLNQRLHIHLGYAEFHQQKGQRLESLVYAAIKEAVLMAKGTHDLDSHAWRMELQRILYEQDITIVYQPIVSLRDGQVFAYEALARGPKESFFASPTKLFSYAEKFDLTYQLETLCREKAILSANKVVQNKKLFLNINPQVINDPNFRRGKTYRILQQVGLGTQDVVLELTERSAIMDYQSFHEAIKYYRKQGYLLAVDDVGAGYSNLQTVAEIKPSYIKIDMSLIRRVDVDPVRKALLETLVNFAHRINAKTIAEGIETLEELKALLEIGIDCGQGYLLARPNSEITPINPKALEMIQDISRNTNLDLIANAVIGELATYQKIIPPNLAVRQVVDIFNHDPHLYGLVVCSDSQIHGLIMRPKLFCTLASQYGYALFMNRRIIEIIDPNPLIVPAEVPISTVAQLVAGRTDEALDDYIIITREHEYRGVVSVRRLLDSMARIQIEQAKNANPLTGLPGNLVIEREINKRLQSGEIFNVLYLDLDNFKAFNDKYGFEHGDNVIRFTADILSTVVGQSGTEEDLVGHIGGDDFLVLTAPKCADRLCTEIIDRFDAEIPTFYSVEDRQRGYIITINRKGDSQEFPLMSISIAHVSNQYHEITNHLELGEIAAGLKKMAKSQPGSVCCKDRRKK